MTNQHGVLGAREFFYRQRTNGTLRACTFHEKKPGSSAWKKQQHDKRTSTLSPRLAKRALAARAGAAGAGALAPAGVRAGEVEVHDRRGGGQALGLLRGRCRDELGGLSTHVRGEAACFRKRSSFLTRAMVASSMAPGRWHQLASSARQCVSPCLYLVFFRECVVSAADECGELSR